MSVQKQQERRELYELAKQIAKLERQAKSTTAKSIVKETRRRLKKEWDDQHMEMLVHRIHTPVHRQNSSISHEESLAQSLRMSVNMEDDWEDDDELEMGPQASCKPKKETCIRFAVSNHAIPKG
jgi:hypothetical protein